MSVLSFNSSAMTAKSSSQIMGAAICAIALSACASTGGGKSLNANGQKADYKEAIGSFTSPAADPTQGDPIAAAAFWGTQFQQKPDDAEVAVNYSAALRKIGSVEEAVKIITAATNRSDSPFVKLEAGKALIEGGRAFEAVRYLEEASNELPNNWSALSAYGVALDQIGEHTLAQTKYDQAIALSPNSPLLLNNKGLSYAMEGDLVRAAYTLRTAAGHPGGDARMRQNLALVLALKGDLREAERLARSDLPPQIADRNIDYFRSLLNQPAYWQDFAADNVDTPVFDKPVAAAAPLKAAPTPKSVNVPKEKPAPTLLEEQKVVPQEENPVAQSDVTPVGATPITSTSAQEPIELLIQNSTATAEKNVPSIPEETATDLKNDSVEDISSSPDLKN